MKKIVSCGLAFALWAPSVDAQVVVPTPDASVRFNDGAVSLLVSQIGYSVSGVRTAYLVSTDESAGAAIKAFTVEDQGGSVVYTGTPIASGPWQTAHFWTLDFSKVAQVGKYRIRAGSLSSQSFDVAEPKALYFEPLYHALMFDQMAIRSRSDSEGGFIDCGSDIRETNSHVTQMCGMLDMLELHGDWFTSDEKALAETLFTHFVDFLEGQQQTSGQVLGGFWTGSQITMGAWPNHLLGTYGLLRLARHYAGSDATRSSELLGRAKRAVDYIHTNLPISSSLSTFLTMDLLIEAEYDSQTSDSGAFTRAKSLATELSKRQVRATSPTPGGLYGLFSDPDSTYSRLNYHAPGDLNGEFWGLPLGGLILLTKNHPTDADAALWKSTLRAFVDGTLKKATSLSPMGLIANGDYSGVRWFSDLFHGMSMTYGLMAAQLVQYGEFLGDDTLYALAEKQLLWVGGLNTGDNFPAAPQPFSCIVGHGYRYLSDGYGQFAGIKGSIVNGLSATPQFQKQMPSGPETPSNLCNESWISHTGGWLSGTAELLAASSPGSSAGNGGASSSGGVSNGGTPSTGGGSGGSANGPSAEGGAGGGSHSDVGPSTSSSCGCRIAQRRVDAEFDAIAGMLFAAGVFVRRRNRRCR